MEKENKISFSYLMNPQIVLPNGDNFELDILFQIGDEIYWFEAKTGNYQRHIDKYSKMISILGIETSKAFMILLDIDIDVASKLSSLYGLSVINVESAEEIFLDIIRKVKISQNVSLEKALKTFNCTLNSSGCNHIVKAIDEEEAWQKMANMYPEEIKSDFTIVQL